MLDGIRLDGIRKLDEIRKGKIGRPKQRPRVGNTRWLRTTQTEKLTVESLSASPCLSAVSAIDRDLTGAQLHKKFFTESIPINFYAARPAHPFPALGDLND